jgi:hypothetical protein
MANDKDTVLLAAYDTLATARSTVQKLLGEGFERGNIGLAAKEKGDGGLVAVTVAETDEDRAAILLNSQGPQVFSRHSVQWRAKGWLEGTPHVDDYTAVELA